MTDHDRHGELAGPYVLGLLSADDRREFEAHLQGCPECRLEVREAELVAEGLGRAVDPQEPPAGLRDRVLAAALAARPAEFPRSLRPVNRPPSRTLAPWLLAAASLAAVAFGLYSWTLQARLRETEAALRAAQARLATIESQVASLRHASDETTQTADVLSAPDVVRVELAGQADAPRARGRALWSPTRGLVLAANNLPALPEGRVYQLWLVTDSAKISAGLMRPDSAGRMQGTSRVTTPQPVAIALTIEPDGGVPAPTGAIYLVGSL
jgi:anti-sigma-K factor RskA